MILFSPPASSRRFFFAFFVVGVLNRDRFLKSCARIRYTRCTIFGQSIDHTIHARGCGKQGAEKQNLLQDQAATLARYTYTRKDQQALQGLQNGVISKIEASSVLDESRNSDSVPASLKITLLEAKRRPYKLPILTLVQVY